jgi:hypothetical protein
VLSEPPNHFYSRMSRVRGAAARVTRTSAWTGGLAIALTLAVVAVVATVARAASPPRSVFMTLPTGLGPQPRGTIAGRTFTFERTLDYRHLWIADQSGAERVLFDLRDGEGAEPAGSASWLAVVHGVRASPELLVGPPGGAFTSVSHCAGPSFSSSTATGRFAVDDDAVAYLDDACAGTGAPLRLVVQPLSPATGPTGKPAVIALPGGADLSDLRLAGRFVAFHLASPTGGQIVEDDWQAGQELVRTSDGGSGQCGQAGAHGDPAYGFCSLALQADGKLARMDAAYEISGSGTKYDPVTSDDTCQGTIDWLSPADAVWHRLVGGQCGAALWMAGDRVLAWSPWVLHVFGLDGSSRSLGDPDMVYSFDGQRALVADETCTEERVISLSVLGDEPPLLSPSDRPPCPMRFSRWHLILGAHPRVTVVVSCPNGCRGPLVAGTRGGRWQYLNGHSPSFILEPGGQQRLVIPLARRSHTVRTAKRQRTITIFLFASSIEQYDPHVVPERQILVAIAHHKLRPTRPRELIPHV